MSECLIRSTDTLVRNQASTLEPDHTLDCAPISIKAFCMMTTNSRQRNVEVFSASLRDIAKALDKTKKTKTDPRTKLPSQYLDYLGAFSPTDSDKTPPLRGNGVDHKIELVKEDGKEPAVPWGPLYNTAESPSHSRAPRNAHPPPPGSPAAPSPAPAPSRRHRPH